MDATALDSTTDFDRSSRHLLSAALLREAIEPPGPILEIGGSQGFTADLMPNHDVVVTDIAGSDVGVLCKAGELPFPDDSFEAALVLDVLEHVPASSRAGILREMSRVARSVVVIGGPFRSDAVLAAEERTRNLYKHIAGKEHRWLNEHRDFGLPELAVIKDLIAENGFSAATMTTNPLKVWEPLQFLNFTAAVSGVEAPADRADCGSLLAKGQDPQPLRCMRQRRRRRHEAADFGSLPKDQILSDRPSCTRQ